MDTNANPAIERESIRVQANREELVERIAKAVPADGTIHPLDDLYLSRASHPHQRFHTMIKPSFCVIVQGSKEILMGDGRFVYDPSHYFIATVELPRVSQVLEASDERPYLSARLELDSALVGLVMSDSSQVTFPEPGEVCAMDVSPLDANLQDAVLRLVRLMDTPEEIPVLAPLIKREIIYRLLIGDQGARLRHIAIQGGYTSIITRAVERLRQNYDQPLRIDDLARELGMSVSGLHHQFKAVTAMSPLQFQKQLRLQEARRLMVSEDLDAASAAFRVGYHDASHFNREYKSLFGFPPIRDVQRLRGESMGED